MDDTENKLQQLDELFKQLKDSSLDITKLPDTAKIAVPGSTGLTIMTIKEYKKLKGLDEANNNTIKFDSEYKIDKRDKNSKLEQERKENNDKIIKSWNLRKRPLQPPPK